MSFRLTRLFVFVAAIAVCVLGPVASGYAAPSAAQTAADEGRVERAVARLEAARERAAKASARAEKTSERLDEILEAQEQTRQRLESRTRVMYRSGDTGFVSVLLGAETFQEFASRWDLLTRMSRQDAADLESLAKARIETERSAKSLLRLQEQQARAVDLVERELAAARRELADSRAALAAYEARSTPAPAKKRASKPKRDATQGLRGSGAWKTAVASHYGRNFTGRGASGARIGPYSMIVAHKTLPFGTLIEFEYRGKRAVARVVDRGPFTAGRTFDLGPGVVRVLGFNGVHKVRYRVIRR